jgi:hypothetical protein
MAPSGGGGLNNQNVIIWMSFKTALIDHILNITFLFTVSVVLAMNLAVQSDKPQGTFVFNAKLIQIFI